MFKNRGSKSVQIMNSPIQKKLDDLIDELAPAIGKNSIILVHPVTWDSLIDEFLRSSEQHELPDIVENHLLRCSFRDITVMRSSDYPMNEWGIYL